MWPRCSLVCEEPLTMLTARGRRSKGREKEGSRNQASSARGERPLNACNAGYYAQRKNRRGWPLCANSDNPVPSVKWFPHLNHFIFWVEGTLSHLPWIKKPKALLGKSRTQSFLFRGLMWSLLGWYGLGGCDDKWTESGSLRLLYKLVSSLALKIWVLNTMV